MKPVTLITGAAGALGSAVARHLLAHGHAVAAAALPRSLDKLRALEGALPLAFDSDDASAWAAPLAEVEAKLGPLTGAVLTAGGWRGGEALWQEQDDAVWEAMIAQNLGSAHRALRALLPGMVQRGRGSIVLIGSRAAVRPDTSAGAAAYAAAKAGAVALAQAAAAEVLERGVRVNAVLPSTIDTAANRAAMPKADPARWVSTGSIAEVIAFLLSDAARDVSGAALPIYGRA